MNGSVSWVEAPVCGNLEAHSSWANDTIVRRRLELEVVEVGRRYYVLFIRFGRLSRVGKRDCVWAGIHDLGVCNQTKNEPAKTCDKVNDGLESRAATVWRCRRAGQPSLPKL